MGSPTEAARRGRPHRYSVSPCSHSLARAQRLAKRGQKGWRGEVSVSNALRGRAAHQRRFGDSFAKRTAGVGEDRVVTVVLEGHHSDRSIEAPKPALGRGRPLPGKGGKCAREGARHSASVLTSAMAVRRQPPMWKAERMTSCHREVASPWRWTGRKTSRPRRGPVERRR